MNDSASQGTGRLGLMARSAQLLRFASRYRHLAGAAGERGSREDADEFVADIQRLGPAFIKIGQALSVRPDLLPLNHLKALQKLQDDVTPVPVADVRAVIERELGVRLSKIFPEFDDAPLAAASLAQVHAAVLRDGREVVVKVQRPGIADSMESDMTVLRGFAGAADRFTDQGRRIGFGDWIEEMAETLAEELDYRLEAANMRALAGQLADYPALFVPAPIADFSTRQVLTMDRVRGSKISQHPGLQRLEHPLADLARDLVRAYLDQIFVHRLVHADPHPGNLILCGERLALIDAGMVLRLAPRMRDNLLALMQATVEGDSGRAAQLIERMGERLPVFDERAWQRRCDRLVLRYCNQSLNDEVGAGELLLALARQSVESGLRPPPEMPALGRTLLALEGSAKRLDPRLRPNLLVREKLDGLIGRRVSEEFSPTRLRAQLIELAGLGTRLPQQLRDALELVAQNRLRVRISGLGEARLLENLQKIANRISAGLISAGLVVAAALTLRIDAGPRLLGYPALALILFLTAFGLGAALVVSALRSDRRK
ncbi:ABC1 kinase family protein [Tahibacter harae]|uniref:AarF/UbiB family protein n=1 Tax=Tahibacter harae TaxID=2963937 RepID=A0ABT1QL67_9GAMM|nr:AarF/UbiB family protein [Tahibacter harae]MCQ4163268.1 AarF/UbiB family protein [Tahibacter harae]